MRDHLTPPASDVPADVIDCRAAVERLWSYLDRELDARAMREVEQHLQECLLCPPHFAFAETLLAAIRGARATDGEPVGLRTRVVGALQAEGFTRSMP